MKIKEIDLFAVGTRRENGTLTPHIIIRMIADDGTVGIGEMSDLGHSPVKPDVVIMEDRLRAALVSVDPFDPPAIDPIVDQYPSPLGSGIDIAIHDLRARHLAVPVHDLYGGAYRDRFKVCYPIFRQFDDSEIDPNIDLVKRMLALGFDLFRVYVGGNVDVDERFFHKLRDSFGDSVKIKSLDFSRRLDWKSCVAAIERLEWVDPILVESPAPDIAGKRKVRERVRFPISEHCGNEAQAIAFAEGEAVDILNITTCHQGIRRSRHLFTIAEACGLATLIGTTQELSVGTSAQAHLGASVPNLEYPGDAAGAQLYIDDVVKERVQYDSGYLVVPEGNGLGMELDESLLDQLGDNRWGFFLPQPLGRQEDRK
jgi:L-alanine-DL-glutamate epimerase-like enolase superfamily enzyme